MKYIIIFYSLISLVNVGAMNKKAVASPSKSITAYLKIPLSDVYGLTDEFADELLFKLHSYPTATMQDLVNNLRDEAQRRQIKKLTIRLAGENDQLDKLKSYDPIRKKDKRLVSHWIDEGKIYFNGSFNQSKLLKLCCILDETKS